MISHSLTNFAVNRDHVPTIVSQLEILSSLARGLCSAAQHLVYINESAVQKSEQTLFHRLLGTAKLHHLESIHHWLFDRIFHLLLHRGESSMGMCSLQLLCPGSSSPIQTASDFPRHQDLNTQVKVSLRNVVRLFPTFVPSNQAPVIIPFIITPAIMKPRIVSGTRLCRFLSFGACL